MPSITAGDRKRGREREGKEGREGREKEKEGGRKKGGTIIQNSIDYYANSPFIISFLALLLHMT